MTSHRALPVSLRPYASALLTTTLVGLLAFLLRRVLRPELPGQIAGPLFFAAVVVSAWRGGLGPGLLAAALSILALEYFFLPPVWGLRLGWCDAPRLAVYLLTVVLVSRLLGHWRKSADDLSRTQEGLRAARAIQQRLFPGHVPALTGFDLAGACHPAEAIGGDCFDYVRFHGGGFGLVVADVSGHGLGPALLMAETRAFLRAFALRSDDPGEVLTLANRLLSQDSSNEHFCTLFLGRLDCGSRSLLYASAGHEGYLLDADGQARLLRATSMPLGIAGDLVVPCADPLRLAPGQILVVFTDGVQETQGTDGTHFGAGRAIEVVRANRLRPAREIVAGLLLAVRAFSGERRDDVTVVVLKAQPTGEVGLAGVTAAARPAGIRKGIDP